MDNKQTDAPDLLTRVLGVVLEAGPIVSEAVRRSGPPAAMHLFAAGRELVAAARSVISAFNEAVAESDSKPAETAIQRIEVRRPADATPSATVSKATSRPRKPKV